MLVSPSDTYREIVFLLLVMSTLERASNYNNYYTTQPTNMAATVYKHPTHSLSRLHLPDD